MNSCRSQMSLVILVLAAFASSVQAQNHAPLWTEWETLTPENEEFTVSMPKNTTTEATKFPYQKLELSVRSYLASSSEGAVLAIISMNGIRSDPTQYTDFARFNAYVDAFKTFFPPKIRSKEAVTQMTLLSSRPFHGYTGRSYKLTIGDLVGSVHGVLTKKRFYGVVSLNTKRDEALDEKFFSSFVLPDNPTAPPKAEANAGDEATPPSASTTQDQKNAPVSAGMLNGKAIYLPIPEVPARDATGIVLVTVIVDESGRVVEAHAVSGPSALLRVAEQAALLARFPPTLVMGKAVKVTGTLSYQFRHSN